jgi:hypothetical protein
MKKKHILILSFVLLVNLMSAQIDKGNWMVGGSGFIQNYKVEYTSNNTTQNQSVFALQISPNIGFFILDKFAVGGLLTFNFNNPSGSNNSSQGYGIAPFTRYYFLQTDKPINFFAQASFEYSEGRTNNTASIKNFSRGYAFKAGPAIYFNSSVALEVTLNYSSSKNSDNIKGTLFGAGVGLQIHLEKK